MMVELGARTEPLSYGAKSHTRALQKAETRKCLLEAACELFITHGVEKTTIDAIAERAGVSRATVYLHFSSQNAIVEELRSELTGKLDRHYERLADLGNAGRETIEKWVQAFVELSRDDKRIVFMLMRSEPAERQIFNARGYYQSVIARLARGLPKFAEAQNHEHSVLYSQAMLFLMQLEALLRYSVLQDDEQGNDNLARAVALNLHSFLNG